MKRKTKKNQNGGKIRARKPHRQTPCTGMVPTKRGQRSSRSRINKHKGQETAREGSSGSFIKQEPSEHLEVRFLLFSFYKIKKEKVQQARMTCPQVNEDQCTRRLWLPPYYWPSLTLPVCAGHCHVVSYYMERPTQTETERGLSQQLMRNQGFHPATGKEVNPANNHVSEHRSNLQVWLQTWLTPGLLPWVLRAEASSKTIPRFPSHRHGRGRQVVYCFKHWRVNKRQELISKASNEQTEEILGKGG